MDAHSDSERFTTGQAAELCGVTADTMLRWVKSGRLRAERTAGGHYRIPCNELVPLVRSQVERSGRERNASQPLYCWEYFSRQGAVRQECHECIVYKSGAALCFRLLESVAAAGHGKRHCREACDQCAFYRRVNSLPTNILVITPDPGSMSGLGESSTLKVRFARTAYDASAAIHGFWPGFVVIDDGFSSSDEAELISCLMSDKRVPGLRIMLTAHAGGRRRAIPSWCKDSVIGVLPKPLSASCIESLINCVPVPAPAKFD
ncbi:MAG: helix-turn-helix domain-containing protein [Acidobacteriales bacterium]|nr:MAG: helix-turn-helix domain-containing protein [Terriglobales bacterium]